MSSDSVAEILAAVDDKPASYLAAARRLAALPARPGLIPLRVFAVSSFTFDLVAPYLVVESARRGLDVQLSVGPYGQLEQQALDSGSALYASAPDVIIVAMRVEDVAPELVDGFLARTPAAIDAAVAAFVERIASLCRAIRERSAARLLVWNQAPLRRLVGGVADASLERSQQHALADLDHRLASACRAISNTVTFDAARLATELGTTRWYDVKLQMMARCPLSGAAQIAVGRHSARMLRAMMVTPAKCLVLDLDNTLWGGVLGEEGIAGIALGDDGPGYAYKEFQRALRGYRDRGVLLAIASKNNPGDVDELFASHRDMVLARDDFAAIQVHWNDKAASLRVIADQLAIGLDSLVFFDDNPVERSWVREQVPEVTVIDVPRDPSRFVDALDDSGAFDHLVVTLEDRARADQYRTEIQRQELQRSAGSVEEFLAALQMKVVIGRIDATTLPRVAQLLGKTNQFNLTTRRHSESELAAMLAGEETIGLWMRVSDRYGDHGLVGVAIALASGRDYRLDSFLMSCRVLGRTVEHALLHSVIDRVRRRGVNRLYGELIPTKKNAPAAGFFAEAGFTALDDRPGWWCIDVAAAPAAASRFEVIEES
jgi:FkbH-like protein